MTTPTAIIAPLVPFRLIAAAMNLPTAINAVAIGKLNASTPHAPVLSDGHPA
jgi:hypothetical protein